MRLSHWSRNVAVVACALAAFALVHLVMETTALWAERTQQVHLWWREEFLQLLTPANYVGRGGDRILLYGPSEAREGFLEERFESRLPEWRAFQDAQSLATLEDALVYFEYVERAYGSSAVPAVLLCGLSPRFMANICKSASPLLTTIERYSPRFAVDDSGAGVALVERGWPQSWLARLRFFGHQQLRYRAALRVAARAALESVGSRFARAWQLQQGLRPAKYHGQPPFPHDELLRQMDTPGALHRLTFEWDPAPERERIQGELARLAAFAERHGTLLYFALLPEHSLGRARYLPGANELYREIVAQAAPGVPLADLREFLRDDEFFDVVHPTHAGAVRLSDHVAELLAVEIAARRSR